MKSLIKNYIDLLNIEKLKTFSLKYNINLTNSELEYILNLLKNNYDDIINNDEKYLENIKNNINPLEFNKLKALYTHYKIKYKGYLF